MPAWRRCDRRAWLRGALMAGIGAWLGGGSVPVRAAPSVVADARPVLPDAPALAAWVEQQIQALGPAPWWLLGEQHDADAHQTLQVAVVRVLAGQGALAAVVLEMAERGRDSGSLRPDAPEEAVRQALAWHDAGWPWARYGPVVMAAVRAGVPVVGANLPRAQHHAVMADADWDTLLPADGLHALERLIDTAHCGVLPAAQLRPMARIQIARDDSMAATLLAQHTPGRTVLLITGAQHARRPYGVPLHLARRAGPAAPAPRVVELVASDDAPAALVPTAAADALWLTPAVPPVDHCAGLRARR
ncbi:ChaN family lipoprotein [Tepidimonas thermarum]|nr:ChaN family lipoprotein [Tepidimonas thermarum]